MKMFKKLAAIALVGALVVGSGIAEVKIAEYENPGPLAPSLIAGWENPGPLKTGQV